MTTAKRWLISNAAAQPQASHRAASLNSPDALESKDRACQLDSGIYQAT